MEDVVIVSPTYPSSNPRVVKEADALHAAGFRVRVVFSQGPIQWARRDDELLLETKPWVAVPVRWSSSEAGERLRYATSALRFHAFRRLPGAMLRVRGVAERAEGRTYPELAAAAASVPARLYVGHYPEGLAAAAVAARRNGAMYAYDAEDLHTGEDRPTTEGRARLARVDRIERRWIGGCAYVSAVSDGVAEAIAARYGVRKLLVIHNAFPWAERSSIDGRRGDRRNGRVSLVWYSQVIGPDRGIEDAIRALPLVGDACELHLGGWCSERMREEIETVAAEVGVVGRVFLHPRVPPKELLSRIAEHDIGLALERSDTPNRALTSTNKLFLYLLAGLAIAASDTAGQRRILRDAPGAAVLYPPGSPEALARALHPMVTNPEALAASRRASLSAARDHWNWERESERLVERVSWTLGVRPSTR